jgi:hypothetical protein
MQELLTVVAIALGLSSPDPHVISAIDKACRGDAVCGAEAVVFADLESGFNEWPKPFSHDAKAGTSCGVFQLPCTFVRFHDLDEQAVQWAALRAWSLEQCSALPESERLAGLASGGCYRGRMLSRSRRALADDALFAARWSLTR